MVKGSAWMTFGSIVSRILGALYIIPWYAWMGSHGNIANALTAKSYNIYSLFIHYFYCWYSRCSCQAGSQI
jgi:O-antigen/teichoic acid export membrane protein